MKFKQIKPNSTSSTSIDFINSLKFYRYEEWCYSSSAWDRDVKILELSYNAIKKTPKGYWLDVDGDEKWVSDSARKRFAYPTKEEAFQSFIYRKKRQIKILENR